MGSSSSSCKEEAEVSMETQDIMKELKRSTNSEREELNRYVDTCLNKRENVNHEELLCVLRKEKRWSLVASVEGYFSVGERLPHRLTDTPDWGSPSTFVDECYCRNLTALHLVLSENKLTIKPIKKGGAKERFTQVQHYSKDFNTLCDAVERMCRKEGYLCGDFKPQCDEESQTILILIGSSVEFFYVRGLYVRLQTLFQ